MNISRKAKDFMTKLQTKKEVNILTLLFTVTYMISYITRINYGAIIAEIEISTGLSRSLLSMAVTGAFITYGAGQVISGICGDRFSTKKLIAYGLILTISMNIAMAFFTNPYYMLVIWCINGFAQAFMWPPLVRAMAVLLKSDDYVKASFKVNCGSSVGTLLVYLISPLIISFFNWQAVFIFSASCAIIMLILWQKFAIDVPPEPKAEKSKKAKGTLKPLFAPIMLVIFFSIVLQGSLRDGITTWMPTYITETYNLSTVVSILTGVIIPIFTILSLTVTTEIYRKKIKNPLACATLFFGIGTVCAVILYIFTGKNAFLSVVSMSLLNASICGVNLLLIGMLPSFFQKKGIVAAASGILNCFTYIGSSISAYGIASLSESFGWSSTILLWIGIACLGTFLCLCCIKPWQKFVKE